MNSHNEQEQDLIDYFQTFACGFHRAQTAAGSHDYFLALGEHTICLRFAGTALIPQITPALAHLKIDPVTKPDLTIYLWDSVSTNTPLPLLASSLIELVSSNFWRLLDTRMEIKGYNSDRFFSIFNVGSHLLSVLDRQENIALYWTEDAQALPYWDRGSPLRGIINWWMSQKNLQFVHAGAVGTEQGAVLLAGKGGSGKSSTALSCLNSDLLYASDDYCLVETDPKPMVYSLYNTAKLKGKEDLARFPHLAPLFNNLDRLDQEKAMIFVREHFPEKIINQLPLKAVLVPRVTGKPDTKISPTSAMVALKALAPSTIFQLPKTGQSAFARMSRLVRQVPAYCLELGTDIPQIPQTIAQLLSEL